MNFTNDDVIGALQCKLPLVPPPFNPALSLTRPCSGDVRSVTKVTKGVGNQFVATQNCFLKEIKFYIYKQARMTAQQWAISKGFMAIPRPRLSLTETIAVFHVSTTTDAFLMFPSQLETPAQPRPTSCVGLPQ